jgi:hypothetical protein
VLGHAGEVLLDVGQVVALDRGRRQQRHMREHQLGRRVADPVPPSRQHIGVRLRDRDRDPDQQFVRHACSAGRKPTRS